MTQQFATRRPRQWIVAPWGDDVNTAEVFNGAIAANVAQDVFRFEIDDRVVPLDASLWRLPDGGLNLDAALRSLTVSSAWTFGARVPVVLVTSQPYSEPGAAKRKGPDAKLPGYFSGTDPLEDGNSSIVSTYLWTRLPARPDISVLAPTGRRNLIPYIVFCLANTAFNSLVETEFHPETLACPNDLCDNVSDIDEFFLRGQWYCDDLCNQTIRQALRAGTLQTDEWRAIRRMLNRARGVPANRGHFSCFISYGSPDQKFAERLQRNLVANGVSCWTFFEDGRPGDETWPDIHEAMRMMDRMILICSAGGLKRPGVLRELRHVIDHTSDRLIPVSIDSAWLDSGYTLGPGSDDLLARIRERTFVNFVKRPFAKAFQSLMKALEWT